MILTFTNADTYFFFRWCMEEWRISYIRTLCLPNQGQFHSMYSLIFALLQLAETRQSFTYLEPNWDWSYWALPNFGEHRMYFFHTFCHCLLTLQTILWRIPLWIHRNIHLHQHLLLMMMIIHLHLRLLTMMTHLLLQPRNPPRSLPKTHLLHQQLLAQYNPLPLMTILLMTMIWEDGLTGMMISSLNRRMRWNWNMSSWLFTFRSIVF